MCTGTWMVYPGMHMLTMQSSSKELTSIWMWDETYWQISFSVSSGAQLEG